MQYNKSEQVLSQQKVRQVFTIAFILLLAILLFSEILFIQSAFFGAVTLYIVLRRPHKYLVRKYRWKKTNASIILLSGTIVLFFVPIYLTIQFITNKVSPYMGSPEPLINGINTINEYIQGRFNFKLLSGANLEKIKSLAGKVIPNLIGSGLIFITDIILLYFLLWYMLNNSFRMERWLKMNSPFNRPNTQMLMKETIRTVNNNAFGIIILGMVQGLIAIIGYTIFGVNEPVLWGLITGAASVIPFAGTMIVWVPLTILLFAQGQNIDGIGLGLWGFILIGGIDNVLRFLLQKRIGQTHPIITVFGVIIGLNLFGFWGLIFGPLLLTLIVMLGRVYRNEYITKRSNPTPETK